MTDSIKKQQLLRLIDAKGIIRTKELKKAGIHHEDIRKLCESRVLIKLSRGLYSLPDRDTESISSQGQKAKSAPQSPKALEIQEVYSELGSIFGTTGIVIKEIKPKQAPKD